ncbi:MAG: hypothetical protein GKR77_04950 [Legionellales bacterium]|nr:hypothetical protein [Legionellales bacterium]
MFDIIIDANANFVPQLDQVDMRKVQEEGVRFCLEGNCNRGLFDNNFQQLKIIQTMAMWIEQKSIVIHYNASTVSLTTLMTLKAWFAEKCELPIWDIGVTFFDSAKPELINAYLHQEIERYWVTQEGPENDHYMSTISDLIYDLIEVGNAFSFVKDKWGHIFEGADAIYLSCYDCRNRDADVKADNPNDDEIDGGVQEKNPESEDHAMYAKCWELLTRYFNGITGPNFPNNSENIATRVFQLLVADPTFASPERQNLVKSQLQNTVLFRDDAADMTMDGNDANDVAMDGRSNSCLTM